jgi:hypothetical protein
VEEGLLELVPKCVLSGGLNIVVQPLVFILPPAGWWRWVTTCCVPVVTGSLLLFSWQVCTYVVVYL